MGKPVSAETENKRLRSQLLREQRNYGEAMLTCKRLAATIQVREEEIVQLRERLAQAESRIDKLIDGVGIALKTGPKAG